MPVGVMVAALVLGVVGAPPAPWPAEAWGAATNLTDVEGPGVNDFHVDLSGAFWNPLTRRLWVCRNGPGAAASKFWVLKENGAGFAVETRSGLRGEWTGFGDLEAITQADLSQDTVYVMIEGEERIKEYSVSTYGTAVLANNWNTRPHLPLDGGLGAEGLAFVPDAYLRAAGFVDLAGQLRVSQRGMGGLMFVGHQNGGKVYVFDLDRGNSTFDFVGVYATNFTETAELFFDRSTGLMFILHGENHNTVQVSTLASSPGQGGERVLNDLATYLPPPGSAPDANLEGLAVMAATDCVSERRGLFMAVDGGGAQSLMWFRQFPCGRTQCVADWDGDGSALPADIAQFVGAWTASLTYGVPIADVDHDGAVTPADIAVFIGRWLAAVSAGC
ncbi:MAG: hypothetical protein KF745_07025 [Phycisphaeraceae bacterium]|nr:hypothetical protein [Phycisphaeraceae bacterium]